MPIEIKELVIRTVVSRGDAAPLDEAAAPGAPEAGDAAEIVQECVRQVLRILAKDRER